jgi:acyl-CoA dehydrogenase family member 9
MVEDSFMKALFLGVVAEDMVFPFPHMSEAERSQIHALVDVVGRFLRVEVDAAAIDESNDIPAPVFAGMRELGLFGLAIPAEYGGMGLSMRGYTRVIQEVASHSAALAHVLLAHESTGIRGLLDFGTKAQKSEWLPKVASGELLAAFALAEERSGTDAGAMLTRLDPDPSGDGFRLSGSKSFVTNGHRAGLFTVFARTTPAEPGQKPHITTVLVERGPGVSCGPPLDTLGLRGAGIGEVSFDNVFVPADRVLGKPTKGFSIAMEVLSDSRAPLAGIYMGQCRALLQRSVERVSQRRSFGRPIQDFPIIKDKIARMMADTYAVESMAYMTAGLFDQGVQDCTLESAICRVAGSEALWRVAQSGIQISGASGFMRNGVFSRHLRDARASFVFDSTNETLRCFIALSGMRAPAEKLDEAAPVSDPIKSFGVLKDYAMRTVRGLTRKEQLVRAHVRLSAEMAILEESAESFAKAVDAKLREHGSEISEMQYVQMRIANAAMDIYAMTACISRATAAIERHGEDGARREIEVTVMFVALAQRRVSRMLAELEANDDDLRKEIAARTCTDGGYPADVI